MVQECKVLKAMMQEHWQPDAPSHPMSRSHDMLLASNGIRQRASAAQPRQLYGYNMPITCRVPQPFIPTQQLTSEEEEIRIGGAHIIRCKLQLLLDLVAGCS